MGFTKLVQGCAYKGWMGKGLNWAGSPGALQNWFGDRIVPGPTRLVCCTLHSRVLLQHRAPSLRALARVTERLLAPGKVRLSFLYCNFCHCLHSLQMHLLREKLKAKQPGSLDWVPLGRTRHCSQAAGSIC